MGFGLRPDLGFDFSAVDELEIIDFDMDGFVFSSFPIELLTEVEFDVRDVLPLDLGDVGGGTR